MQVVAKDENGKEFKKDVRIRSVISFGWPVEYDIDTLLVNYPFTKPLCIDAGGRNHNGSPVYISAEQVNEIFDKIILDKLFYKKI